MCIFISSCVLPQLNHGPHCESQSFFWNTNPILALRLVDETLHHFFMHVLNTAHRSAHPLATPFLNIEQSLWGARQNKTSNRLVHEPTTAKSIGNINDRGCEGERNDIETVRPEVVQGFVHQPFQYVHFKCERIARLDVICIYIWRRSHAVFPSRVYCSQCLCMGGWVDGCGDTFSET